MLTPSLARTALLSLLLVPVVACSGASEEAPPPAAEPQSTDEAAAVLMSHEFNLPILMDSKDWKLPAGAFGENAGPR